MSRKPVYKALPEIAHVILELEAWAQREVDEDGFVHVWPAVLNDAVALLKAVKRPYQGTPPADVRERLINFLVTAAAADRFDALRADNKTREDALHEASEYAAARDPRPEGKALTAATIRERLTRPGDYPLSWDSRGPLDLSPHYLRLLRLVSRD